ncbi:MAG: dicarboxylate/amino acid:cation symporter [Brevundimonas sp.]|uniref:dicarboxylate/amino acid:cation symporter n=1 Tax=Brevundimonas sp. TaxID=1871086 RepID=UPI0025BA1FCF|nr:dicarboxylate/amino acid:cation symporter [Brevundimonas sp.]MBX3478370.1 dicarboxylate/amino acid:cation symporter [Brevundimonas sp.]
MSALPSRPRFLPPLSIAVLIALTVGLAAGAAAQTWGLPGGEATAGGIAALGALWLNALKMTIVPLVFSLLVTGIGSIADAARTGRLAARAILWFGILIVAATIYAVLANYGLLAVWPIDPEGGARLIAGAPATPDNLAPGAPFSEFVKTIAPANPIRAAADDAILGLVVFAVFFGFAASRLPEGQRRPLVTVFEAVAETMIIIVRWVLLAAPLGVFALGLGVGLSAGVGAAGTLLHYVAILVLAQVGLILLTYPVAVMFGRVGLVHFARAAAPAQVVAFSTQSSLASLPVMVERAVDVLGVARPTAGLVLPLAVALFRITSPVANLGVVIFCAHLFGVEVSMAHILAGMLTAILVSIGSVGLPGQISFFVSIAPICVAMGVPVEVLPLLLAVEVIPDIFRTVGNVTADLAVARIVQGGDAEPDLGGEI